MAQGIFPSFFLLLFQEGFWLFENMFFLLFYMFNLLFSKTFLNGRKPSFLICISFFFICTSFFFPKTQDIWETALKLTAIKLNLSHSIKIDNLLREKLTVLKHISTKVDWVHLETKNVISILDLAWFRWEKCKFAGNCEVL